MIGELVMRCLHGRTNAHVLHLKAVGGASSDAVHRTLETFYEEIIPMVDSVAEMVQDETLIDSYPARYTPVESPVELVKSLRDWLRRNRYEAVPAEETEVQNVIDEIIALCRRTLFKLNHLK